MARLTEMVVPLLKVIVIPERLNSSSDNMTGGYLSERRRGSCRSGGFNAAIIITDHIRLGLFNAITPCLDIQELIPPRVVC